MTSLAKRSRACCAALHRSATAGLVEAKGAYRDVDQTMGSGPAGPAVADTGPEPACRLRGQCRAGARQYRQSWRFPEHLRRTDPAWLYRRADLRAELGQSAVRGLQR